MAYVDIKVTTWERVFIKDEDVDLVKTLMEAKQITRGNELWEHIEPDGLEELFEASEDMLLEQNNYNPTMELYDDKGQLLADNDPRKLKKEL